MVVKTIVVRKIPWAEVPVWVRLPLGLQIFIIKIIFIYLYCNQNKLNMEPKYFVYVDDKLISSRLLTETEADEMIDTLLRLPIAGKVYRVDTSEATE